eukprot:TRINITY_DN1409_c0_g1_i8.p4 TRINITY_DN1409_c0_g1~~TRINITY_DN1409_c0_g1_i8.p4  ORF type:complete len:175 (-),score=46.45 TRINITY_DN1409_c0_g1_i8:141-665(-)
MGSKLQRLITRSRFGRCGQHVDHVAMLLRCKSQRVVFVDATANDGVALCDWKDFSRKGYYRCYDKIVYRPLQFARNYANQSLLESFLKKVLGKRYKLSPLRMMQKYSNLDSVTNIAENKGYFCSELVGSAFKLLGFLPKNISSAQYWPGSFSAEEKMVLGSGAAFGDEYLIEFE